MSQVDITSLKGPKKVVDDFHNFHTHQTIHYSHYLYVFIVFPLIYSAFSFNSSPNFTQYKFEILYCTFTFTLECTVSAQ